MKSADKPLKFWPSNRASPLFRLEGNHVQAERVLIDYAIDSFVT
jgi:hypothetical protein